MSQMFIDFAGPHSPRSSGAQYTWYLSSSNHRFAPLERRPSSTAEFYKRSVPPGLSDARQKLVYE